MGKKIKKLCLVVSDMMVVEGTQVVELTEEKSTQGVLRKLWKTGHEPDFKFQ